MTTMSEDDGGCQAKMRGMTSSRDERNGRRVVRVDAGRAVLRECQAKRRGGMLDALNEDAMMLRRYRLGINNDVWRAPSDYNGTGRCVTTR